MSANRTILDSDMDIPESWFTSPTNPNSYLMLTPAIRHSERSKLEPQPSAQSSEAKTEPLSPVQSKPSIPEPQAQSSSQSKLPEAKPEPPQSHHPSDPHDPRNEQLAIIRGHNPYGRTIHLHSLAILPQHQKRGLGKTLIKSYMSRIEGSGIADRIALLAHGPLVGFYESLGFKKKGESPAKFGGGGWVDMVYEFPRPVEPPIVSFVDRPA